METMGDEKWVVQWSLKFDCYQIARFYILLLVNRKPLHGSSIKIRHSVNLNGIDSFDKTPQSSKQSYSDGFIN